MALQTARDVTAAIYVCPTCKSSLHPSPGKLRCAACSIDYPVEDDIPEFIAGELAASPDPQLRRMRFIDKMAGLYETDLWYPLVMKVYGGRHGPLLAQLVRSVADRLGPVEGRVLDVACGPGTFGRRIASPAREIWGVDVSRGMLRQGRRYAASEGVSNLHFARARVEALPFGDAAFDAALCCGSLHLFTDTRAALTEIARVMKPAASLAAFTFTPGTEGLLKYAWFRDWSRTRHGLHVFALDDLERTLALSGFEAFQPEIRGSTLLFSARRAAPESGSHPGFS